MKKVIYWIVNLLEVALLIGAYLINYFTPRKMGMARFVVYENMMLEERYNNLDEMKIVAVGVILLLVVLTIALYFMKKKNIKLNMLIVTLVITVVYVGFTVLNSVNTYSAFYLISPLLGLAALLQILKTLISILFTKKQN